MLRVWSRIGTATLLFGLLDGCAPANPPAPAAVPPPTTAPAHSRDLLLVRDPLGEAELWRTSRTGASDELLLSDLSDAPCVGGQTLVATTARAGVSQLISYDLPSGQQSAIITDTTATLRQPTCDPASDALIYLREPLELDDDEPPPASLWRTTLAGAAPIPAHPAGEIPSLNARWSPDGRQLMFELALETRLVLVTSSQATREISFTGTFDWSPDSRQIVISKREPGLEGRFRQLVLLDAATGSQTTLLDDPQADIYFPAWSPDGSQIAFIRRLLGQPAGELWVVALAAPRTPRQLTNDPAYDNFDPQWSAASAELAWSRATLDQPSFSVWRMALAGTMSPELVAEDALWPRWVGW